jgi:hypothetical protein
MVHCGSKICLAIFCDFCSNCRFLLFYKKKYKKGSIIRFRRILGIFWIVLERNFCSIERREKKAKKKIRFGRKIYLFMIFFSILIIFICFISSPWESNYFLGFRHVNLESWCFNRIICWFNCLIYKLFLWLIWLCMNWNVKVCINNPSRIKNSR